MGWPDAYELLAKGVLYESETDVGFKFDCFRAFFLAEKFYEQADALNKSIKFENVLKYEYELNLFSGMHRDRTETLKSLGKLLDIYKDLIDVEIDLNDFEKYNVSTLIISDEQIQNIEEKFLDNPEVHNDFENVLDDMADTPHPASYDQNVARKHKNISASNSVNNFMGILRITSCFLRNSELIPDVGLKREIFNKCLAYWAYSCLNTLKSINTEAFAQHVEKSGITLDLKDKNQLFNILGLMIPTVITSIMAENLATPKLGLFINEQIESTDVSGIQKLFAAILAIDSELQNWEIHIEEIFNNAQKSSLTSQIIFFKLLYTYLIRQIQGRSATFE